MSTKNLTTAEKWVDVLDNVAGNERETALAVMHGEHLNRYTNCCGWEYSLFADGSVYSHDDDCLTEEDLLAGSEAGQSFMYDGLVRTFWSHAQPEIGNMTLLFDTKTFSKYAGNRTYPFSFGDWRWTKDGVHVEYTVAVMASLAAPNDSGEPKVCWFGLCVRDGWCSNKNDIDCCDVEYSDMPPVEPGASWNDPRRWQEAVSAMESFCASVASGNRATDSRARRAAKSAGLRITKSRKQRNVDQLGGYQLKTKRGKVINGSRFDLTAAAVITYSKQHQH